MTAKTLEEEIDRWEFLDTWDGGLMREANDGAYVMYVDHHAAAAAREKEIEELRARVKELEEMVPRWCEWDSDARRDMTKAGYMGIGDDELIGGKWHRLMVPPIQLPDNNNTKGDL